MSSPQDWINASFQLLAGFVVWMNVQALYRDKKILGISAVPTAMFALWGAWNLYYFYHLDQLVSMYAGLSVWIANLVWLGLYLRYRGKPDA